MELVATKCHCYGDEYFANHTLLLGAMLHHDLFPLLQAVVSYKSPLATKGSRRALNSSTVRSSPW